MFRISKHRYVDSKHSSSNPFDSDFDTNPYSTATKHSSSNPFDSDFDTNPYSTAKPPRTSSAPVISCLKIAEEMREDASKTLVTLHQQGEQITRMHMVAANMDYDLSRGEKLLGSIAGIFSKTWKPKKYLSITGPVITRDDSFKRRGINLEHTLKLGLQPSPKRRSNPRQYSSAPEPVQEKIQLEKAKQDEIGGRIGKANLPACHLLGKQNGDLDPELDDVDEIGGRIGRANLRARHLLGKLVYIMFEERCRIPTTL